MVLLHQTYASDCLRVLYGGCRTLLSREALCHVDSVRARFRLSAQLMLGCVTQDPKVEAVALHVGHVNGAGQKLYESHGYTAVSKTSEWKDLLGINGHNSDLLLMVKRIRPDS